MARVMSTIGKAMATVPRTRPRLQASGLVVQKRLVMTMTAARVARAITMRIGMRVQVLTPRTRMARVSTAEAAHPSVAPTSGVHGLIGAG
jgi:hypothetical protein